MDLKIMPKIWYQFLKHSLMSTAHNETTNKVMLVLLHYVTTCSPNNIVKITCHEIHVCAKKKDKILYFPCLIIAVCKRHRVPEKPIEVVSNPQVGYGKTSILNLLKPKGKMLSKRRVGRRQNLVLHTTENNSCGKLYNKFKGTNTSFLDL